MLINENYDICLNRLDNYMNDREAEVTHAYICAWVYADLHFISRASASLGIIDFQSSLIGFPLRKRKVSACN